MGDNSPSCSKIGIGLRRIEPKEVVMKVHITVFCSECPTEEPKIITLFTRIPVCGRFCLAEAQTKYIRTILRMAAEEIHQNG